MKLSILRQPCHFDKLATQFPPEAVNMFATRAVRSQTAIAPLRRFVPIAPRQIVVFSPLSTPRRPNPIPSIPARQRSSQFSPLRTYHQSHHDPSGTRLATARPLLTSSNFKRAARSPGTHAVIIVAIAGAFIFYFSNLETVPVSGRTRFNVYSAERVRAAGDMQFRALLYQLERDGAHILSEHDWRTARVRRVMGKLIPFSGMADEKWEIFVIDDPRTANAFVLPGGKVFVFSGILPLAATDSALAAVLGHEIAHNVADHVGERMSQSIGTDVILYSAMALVGFLGFGPLLMHWIGSRALDIVFGNPMSRLQESEADYIGLMMMAEACYDPRDAVRFWARMEAAKGEEIPEWLSTHPSVSFSCVRYLRKGWECSLDTRTSHG